MGDTDQAGRASRPLLTPPPDDARVPDDARRLTRQEWLHVVMAAKASGLLDTVAAAAERSVSAFHGVRYACYLAATCMDDDGQADAPTEALSRYVNLKPEGQRRARELLFDAGLLIVADGGGNANKTSVYAAATPDVMDELEVIPPAHWDTDGPEPEAAVEPAGPHLRAVDGDLDDDGAHQVAQLLAQRIGAPRLTGTTMRRIRDLLGGGWAHEQVQHTYAIYLPTQRPGVAATQQLTRLVEQIAVALPDNPDEHTSAASERSLQDQFAVYRQLPLYQQELLVQDALGHLGSSRLMALGVDQRAIYTLMEHPPVWLMARLSPLLNLIAEQIAGGGHVDVKTLIG